MAPKATEVHNPATDTHHYFFAESSTSREHSVMSNWSLGARLGAAFAALVTLVSIALWLSLGGLHDNQRRFATVYHDRVEPLQQIAEVRERLGYMVRVAQSDDFTAADARRQVAFASVAVDSLWARYRATYLTPEEQQLIGRAEPAMAALRSTVDSVLRSRDDSSIRLGPMALGRALARASDALTDLVALQVRVAREEFVAAEASAATRSRWSVFLSAIAVAAMFGFALYLYRGLLAGLRVVRQRLDSMGGVCIAGLRAGMNALANGAFDVDVQPKTRPIGFTRRDEIGALAAAFDRVLGDTQAIVAEYNRARGTLSTMASRLQTLGGELANGNVAARADLAALNGEFLRIAEDINRALDTVITPMERATIDFGATLQQMATGDLTVRPSDTHAGVHATTAAALTGALTTLDHAVASVATAGHEIAAAAQQIAAGAEAQARASADQAARIEEITAASNDVRQGARDVAHEAGEARRCTESATQATATGTASLQALTDSLARMRASADSTARVVRTIDELAFQTNLLALNAAVEAARAGDAGRGFAVVAEEVRALARRSAEAARQTADLIHASLDAVRDGAALGDRAAQDISGIETHVQALREHIERVANTSQSQTASLEHVGEALSAINVITQQGVATAEATFAAAEELRGQSATLAERAAGFRVTQRAESGGAGGRRSKRRVA